MVPVEGNGPVLPLPVPRLARQQPETVALELRGRAVGYGELGACSDRLARQMAGLGVGASDRVAVLLPSGLRFAALLHACARLEAVLVPLNSRLSEGELAWQLADAEPSLVVVAAEWRDRVKGRASAALACSAAADDRARRDRGPEDGPIDVAAMGEREAKVLPGLLGVVEDDSAVLRERVPLEAAQAIVYTSGTTGRPKGAVLSFGSQLWSALGSSLRLGVDPAERWLAPLPLFHVGGMAVLWRSALAGTTALLPGEPFSAEGIAASMAADAVTMVSLVPTMLARVLDEWGDRPAPAGLRAVLLGGGPIAPELLARAFAMGFPIAPTYGLSEAASQVATAAPMREMPAGGVAVPPLPFTELRVVDREGQDLPAGQAGQILVRGPSVMSGYWRRPGASARALAGGWLHTGDLGWLDERGRLAVGGRRDDLIVTGGENVYPAEVEAALAMHPEVLECCVLAEADAEWGQRVIAVVTPAGERPARLTALEAEHPLVAALDGFLRPRLAGYKRPRRYLLAPGLPRTGAGKVARGRLREAIAALA